MPISGIRHKPKAALLSNVASLLEAIEKLRTRKAHLPGLAVAYGPSGYGKSVAATVAAAEYDSVYVEAGASWTRRSLVEALAFELGVQIGRTLAQTTIEVERELAASQRIVLIDEADLLVDRNLIEFVRELHMKSGAAIVLLGEEALPHKLARTERVHNRVLEWVPFAPASLDDARQLAGFYVKGCQIADDLLVHLVTATRGRVRRIVVNLDRIEQEAVRDGVASADRDWWSDRPLYTSDAPRRQVV
jgi:DNA transposition AAA+ family ATPase